MVKGLGWGGVGEPAHEDKGEGDLQESEIVDVSFDEGCDESTVLPSYWDYLPDLAGHSWDFVGQRGPQASVVGDRFTRDLVGGCTLPSLRELGLDVYVGRRN